MITLNLDSLPDPMPGFITCTPLTGEEQALPAKTASTAGNLRWRWRPGNRQVETDGARLRIGDRTVTIRYPRTPPATGEVLIELRVDGHRHDPRRGWSRI